MLDCVPVRPSAGDVQRGCSCRVPDRRSSTRVVRAADARLVVRGCVRAVLSSRPTSVRQLTFRGPGRLEWEEVAPPRLSQRPFSRLLLPVSKDPARESASAPPVSPNWERPIADAATFAFRAVCCDRAEVHVKAASPGGNAEFFLALVFCVRPGFCSYAGVRSRRLKAMAPSAAAAIPTAARTAALVQSGSVAGAGAR
jgi:hypothetical protein